MISAFVNTNAIAEPIRFRLAQFAWVLTFPGAALIGAAGYWLAHLGIEPFVAH